MTTTRLPTDFNAFLRLIHDHDVRYLIVGGYAVGYHGYPRATGDMDVWVDATRERDEIGGTPVYFIGLEKLKENKRVSGRHKDVDDLENLPEG